MELGLTGRYALITGGSHGIGLATACALADEGCNVAICARNAGRVDQAVRELKTKGVEVLGVLADVLIPTDIERAMKAVVGSWGTLHILVNNVGGGGRWGSPSVEDTPEEVWIDVYNKNAMAAVRFTRLALPYMRKQKWGRVVAVASIIGRQGGGRPWFSMAKSAEISFMKTLAMDATLVRDGVTFNSVAPGSIMIAGTGWEDERQKNPKQFERAAEMRLPLGRLGTPEEVANAIVFVCSEKASLLNGACLVVDGGESSAF
ncbi:MAG TPA: SDR family oxidoreductase [Blastocatellia bacterium]|nr:SDR family oxidoreductase [Blastocatellia bacterium]